MRRLFGVFGLAGLVGVVGLVVLAGAAPSFAGTPRSPSTSTTTQQLSVALGGTEVGSLVATDTVTPDGVVLERAHELVIQRGSVFNKTRLYTKVLLKPDLTPISYVHERTDASGTLRYQGTIVDGKLQLKTTQNGATVETTTELPKGTTLALALEYRLRVEKKPQRVEATCVLEEMGAAVPFVGFVERRGGGFLLSLTFQGITTDEEADADMRTIVARTPKVGIVVYPKGKPPKDLALKDATSDLMAMSTWTVARVAPPVSRVLYRIYAPEADKFEVPEDDRQKVRGRHKEYVDVEVLAGVASKAPLSAQRKRELLAETPYEAVHDPRIERAAAEATKGARDKNDEVGKLVRYVFDLVDAKGLDRGYAPAVTTLEARSGDCTEHSVLLSALLRARGIPTRIVDGVVVDGTHAGYHEWVEAWLDGVGFVPADPTFGQYPAGPERLKLAVGSTAPQEQLALSLAAARLMTKGVRLEVIESTPAVDGGR